MEVMFIIKTFFFLEETESPTDEKSSVISEKDMNIFTNRSLVSGMATEPYRIHMQ
jgi:hypothetical protein